LRGGKNDLERVAVLPKVWEEVEAQNRVEQVVVWILQATLLQNACWDLREAVWDGERWGANREGVGGGEKRFWDFYKRGILK